MLQILLKVLKQKFWTGMLLESWKVWYPTVTEFIKTLFTSYFRIVMMPGEKKEGVFVLQHTTLKEGEMQGISLKNINKWVTRDEEFKVKIIIYCLIAETLEYIGVHPERQDPIVLWSAVYTMYCRLKLGERQSAVYAKECRLNGETAGWRREWAQVTVESTEWARVESTEGEYGEGIRREYLPPSTLSQPRYATFSLC